MLRLPIAGGQLGNPESGARRFLRALQKRREAAEKRGVAEEKKQRDDLIFFQKQLDRLNKLQRQQETDIRDEAGRKVAGLQQAETLRQQFPPSRQLGTTADKPIPDPEISPLDLLLRPPVGPRTFPTSEADATTELINFQEDLRSRGLLTPEAEEQLFKGSVAGQTQRVPRATLQALQKATGVSPLEAAAVPGESQEDLALKDLQAQIDRARKDLKFEQDQAKIRREASKRAGVRTPTERLAEVKKQQERLLKGLDFLLRSSREEETTALASGIFRGRAEEAKLKRDELFLSRLKTLVLANPEAVKTPEIKLFIKEIKNQRAASDVTFGDEFTPPGDTGGFLEALKDIFR